MKTSRIGILVAAQLCLFPASVWAQNKPAAEEAPAAEGAEGAAEAPAAEGAAAEGAAAEGAAEEEVGEEGPTGLEDICKIDPAACPQLDMQKEAAKPLPEQIFAVQQRFIIKRGRFELNPYWSFTMNDQFVSHPAPGLSINYYLTEVLAIGLNGNYYRPFNVDSAFNAQVRRSARVAVPLTEYDWSAALQFMYVPADGKFAGFGDFIFHYDAFVVGGVGAISTRPIPVIDPNNRNFEFEPKLAFNAGIGLRIFFNRWFAAVLQVNDIIFQDQLESLQPAPTPEGQRDPDTWLGEKTLTNNVQAQAGISIFIPFSFEYRLPK
jgi:outer membrane beta-barrel protein